MSKRLVIKGVSFTYLSQFVTLLYGIISLPLLLQHFGTSLYGLWVLIFTLVSYLNNLSFGVPLAMSAIVAKTANQNEKYQVLKKSVFTLLCMAVFVLVAFLLATYFHSNWIISFLGRVPSQDALLAKEVFTALLLITLIKMPFNLYSQFFTGMNLVYMTQVYTTLTAMINLLTVLLVVFLHLDMLWFAVLIMSGQFCISFISFLHVLLKFAYLKRAACADKPVKSSLIFKSSCAFFQVGVAATLVWSTDNLVISHFISAAAVTPYAVAFKIFSYLFLTFAMINTVVAPLYGNAFADKNLPRANYIFSNILNLLPILAGFLWIGFIFFAQEAIHLWTHNPAAFGGYFLIFSLGFSGYLSTYISIYAGLVQGMNWASKTLKVTWAEGILNPLLSIAFVIPFGVGGVAFGNAIATLVTGFLFLPRYIKKLSQGEIICRFGFLAKHFGFLVLPCLGLSLLSIYLASQWLKIICFVPIGILYFFISWKLLDEPSRLVAKKLIKREKNV